MTAAEVLEKLDQIGVTAWVVEGNIRLQPSGKITPELRTEIRGSKAEILCELQRPFGDGQALRSDLPKTNQFEEQRLIARLQSGQTWLWDQRRRWQISDLTAACDAEFSRVWNTWWEMDERLRTDYGFLGCVYGPDGSCPDGFPCLGCSELPAPAVVAQLAMT